MNGKKCLFEIAKKSCKEELLRIEYVKDYERIMRAHQGEWAIDLDFLLVYSKTLITFSCTSYGFCAHVHSICSEQARKKRKTEKKNRSINIALTPHCTHTQTFCSVSYYLIFHFNLIFDLLCIEIHLFCSVLFYFLAVAIEKI